MLTLCAIINSIESASIDQSSFENNSQEYLHTEVRLESDIELDQICYAGELSELLNVVPGDASLVVIGGGLVISWTERV
jgi:hypothetical protein